MLRIHIRKTSTVWLIVHTIFIVSGCSTITYDVKINEIGDYPKPLIQPINLMVGIHYDEQFRNYNTVQEVNFPNKKLIFKIELGKANVAFFDYIFHYSFRKVTILQNYPQDIETIDRLDLIAIPELKNYSFGVVKDLHINYKINFYLPNRMFLKSYLLSTNCRRNMNTWIFSYDKLVDIYTKEAMRNLATKYFTDSSYKNDIKKMILTTPNP